MVDDGPAVDDSEVAIRIVGTGVGPVAMKGGVEAVKPCGEPLSGLIPASSASL